MITPIRTTAVRVPVRLVAEFRSGSMLEAPSLAAWAASSARPLGFRALDPGLRLSASAGRRHERGGSSPGDSGRPAVDELLRPVEQPEAVGGALTLPREVNWVFFGQAQAQAQAQAAGLSRPPPRGTRSTDEEDRPFAVEPGQVSGAECVSDLHAVLLPAAPGCEPSPRSP